MTIIENTDPALSVPAPEPIGRLYRFPGSDPLLQKADGSVIVPHQGALLEKIAAGEFVPSVTNVIGVLSKDHLINWSGRKSTEAILEFLSRNPEDGVMRLLKNQKEAIKHYSLTSERDRDRQALRGTRVHEACEFIGLGKDLSELGYELTDDEMACVDSFNRWLDMWQPEFLANEMSVFGETTSLIGDEIVKRGYAGTADFVIKVDGRVVIGDIKTTRSGLHNEIALQLTACTRAQKITLDQENLIDNFPIEAGIGLHLSPDGFIIKQASMTDQEWAIFGALRESWSFNAFNGQTAPNHRALNKFIGKPSQLVY